MSRRKSAIPTIVYSNNNIVTVSSNDEIVMVSSDEEILIGSSDDENEKAYRKLRRQSKLREKTPVTTMQPKTSIPNEVSDRTKRKSVPAKRYIEESEVSYVRRISPIKHSTKSPVSKSDMKPINVMKTPKKTIEVDTAKTPHSLRVRIRKKLNKMKIVSSSSESDFSPNEDDEFVPGTHESESSDEQSEDDEICNGRSDSDEEDKLNHKPSTTLSASVVPLARGRFKSNQSDFVLQSDEYFTSHSTNKAFTSDRTLESLKTPRLQHDQLFSILESMKIPAAHEKAIGEIIHEYKRNFRKWMLLLDEGFSILLYGLGSKQKLIQDFHQLMLQRRNVLVVNGFFPALNVKDIIEMLAVQFLDISVPAGNLNVGLDLIEEVLCANPQFHIFLIVHNIDGTMLRNEKSQKILSRLVKLQNIHLIASIDHINAPMLWNPEKLASYNFSWWDVTTLLPYSDETAFENSILVQNSGALALSSLKNVFLSLTTNAKGIYQIIVNHQLTEKENAHYQGMSFKVLYLKCRESFLVSSDLALRAQLTEFLDHKLVKMKRSADGKEHLNIPIENKLLQKFKDELAE